MNEATFFEIRSLKPIGVPRLDASRGALNGTTPSLNENRDVKMPPQNARVAAPAFWVSLLAVWLGALSTPLAGTSFSDTTFQDGSWELVTLTYNVYSGNVLVPGVAGGATAGQMSSGGFDGPYRQVAISVEPATEAHYNYVVAVSFKAGAVFDPSLQGPIGSIDFHEHAITTSVNPPNGCNCQGTGMSLRQAGVIYQNSAGWTTASAGGGWESRDARLTASDFCAIPQSSPCVDHPDFTTTGSAIEFGFFTSNANTFGAIGFTSVGGTDQWSVTINSPGGPGEVGNVVEVRRADGDQITVSWQSSCSAVTDYSIYEGSIGDWYSHLPRSCSDVGLPNEESFSPAQGNTYYLVIPIQSEIEGSYGLGSDGQERPRSSAPCMNEQVIVPCQ